jgi:hypothetical protein
MVSRKTVTRATLLKAKAKIQRQGTRRKRTATGRLVKTKRYYQRGARTYGDNPRIKRRERKSVNLREIWEVNYALKKAKGKRPSFPYSIMLFVNGYEKQAIASKDAKFLKNYVARKFDDLDVKVVKGKVKKKK